MSLKTRSRMWWRLEKGFKSIVKDIFKTVDEVATSCIKEGHRIVVQMQLSPPVWKELETKYENDLVVVIMVGGAKVKLPGDKFMSLNYLGVDELFLLVDCEDIDMLYLFRMLMEKIDKVYDHLPAAVPMDVFVRRPKKIDGGGDPAISSNRTTIQFECIIGESSDR